MYARLHIDEVKKSVCGSEFELVASVWTDEVFYLKNISLGAP